MTKKHEYVIAYCGAKRSFFDKMTGIGPKFGAKRTDTPRFGTRAEAQAKINEFPLTAAAMCDVVEVPAKKESRRG